MTNLNQNLNFIDETIDLRTYVKILRKWRRVIILITVLSVFTSAILSFFVLPPVYESRTLLLMVQARDKPQVIQRQGGLDEVVSVGSRLPEMTMNTYLGQLKSEVLLQRVIGKTKLDSDLYSPQTLSTMIKATVVKDSNLIDINVQNNDPKLAASIANTLSKEYLQFISEKNQEQMTRSISFLEQQLKTSDEKIKTSVEALKKFQAQPRGVAVLEQGFKKKSEDLAHYESQLKIADVELQRLSAGVSRLEQELSSVPKMVSNEKFDAENSATVTFQEVSPVYITISQQFSEKKVALAEKQAEKQGLQSMVNLLRQELDKLQAEHTGKKIQQDKLQGEMDRLKQTSETLAQKTMETQIAKSIDLGDTSVIIVSEASVPTVPVKPKKKLNIILAFVLGLIASTALVFVLEHLDNTIKTPEDVTGHLELPVLGVIPISTKRTEAQSSYGGR